MRCPYCAEEVKDDAVVCKHCHCELFVVKPLLNKISEMHTRLAALEENAEHTDAEPVAHSRHTAARRQHLGLSALEVVSLTYITLVVAQFLIVVQYDLKLLYLHLATMVIPFIFGLLCRDSENSNLLAELVWGVVVAAAAILSMAAVVAAVDKGQIMPKDAYEWRDYAIHVASIAFGFLTGVIVRSMLIAIYSPNAKPNKVIEWIARFIVDQFGDGKQKFTLRSIRSMVSSVLGFGSAVISIASGLWEVLK